MITKDEAADEMPRIRINSNNYTIKDAFKAGVEFAEQWIKVEDELPEIKEDAYEVLVQNSDKRCKVIRIFDEGEVVFISSHFTHWRPINRV